MLTFNYWLHSWACMSCLWSWGGRLLSSITVWVCVHACVYTLHMHSFILHLMMKIISNVCYIDSLCTRVWACNYGEVLWMCISSTLCNVKTHPEMLLTACKLKHSCIKFYPSTSVWEISEIVFSNCTKHKGIALIGFLWFVCVQWFLYYSVLYIPV